jgi:hypothetical protein
LEWYEPEDDLKFIAGSAGYEYVITKKAEEDYRVEYFSEVMSYKIGDPFTTAQAAKDKCDQINRGNLRQWLTPHKKKEIAFSAN